MIGATALAVRLVSRSTHDIDLFTVEAPVLKIGWNTLLDAAVNVDVRKGEFDDPLAGVVRFSRAAEAPVDLVVGKWKWEQDLIARSAVSQFGRLALRVPSAPDLALLKIAAGGYLDLRDAAQLVHAHGEGVLTELAAVASGLPAELSAAVLRFIDEITA